jgi:hypothetical protein
VSLKTKLQAAVDDFDATAVRLGIKPPRVCECGCYEIGHEDSTGRCRTNYKGCRCPKFRPLRKPEANPFTTGEHYARDRKGPWTGD